MTVQNFCYCVAIVTLSCVMLSVIGVMLIGLFDDHVNNDKIFDILSPAFSAVTGALIGLVGGRMAGK